MFDSSFAYCPVCRAYVFPDQTQRQYAREHASASVPKCPFNALSRDEFRKPGSPRSTAFLGLEGG
jgi:hypothetical protein